MICPQCSNHSQPGAARCRSCGRPFARAAGQQERSASPHRESVPAGVPAPEPVTTAYAARAGGRRGRRAGCLPVLAVAGLLVVGLVVGLLLAGELVVKPIVRDRAVAELREGVRDEVAAQISGDIGEAPGGEVVITEAELNQRLDAASLDPIEDVAVEITPTGLVVALEAYQLNGTYHTQVIEQDGSVVLQGGDISGPLSFVVPSGELEAAVNAELSTALADAGYVVDTVALGDGVMTLAVGR
jgi:hypothetical protein